MALQPMPFLLWLELNDQALLSDVNNAYRKLSRVHHPDKGGSLAMWDVTRLCKALLNDEDSLSAYVLGRNHHEFVLVGAKPGLTMKQRVEQQRRAREAAQQEKKKRTKSKSDKKSIFDYEKDESAATDARRQKQTETKQALEDMNASIATMSKPAVRPSPSHSPSMCHPHYATHPHPRTRMRTCMTTLPISSLAPRRCASPRRKRAASPRATARCCTCSGLGAARPSSTSSSISAPSGR